jgi:serine/threonine-protein kinase HipA
MRIGGENRPKWIMKRHWEKYCEETKIPFKMLQREAKNLIWLIIQEADCLTENTIFLEQQEVTHQIKDPRSKNVVLISPLKGAID